MWGLDVRSQEKYPNEGTFCQQELSQWKQQVCELDGWMDRCMGGG